MYLYQSIYKIIVMCLRTVIMYFNKPIDCTAPEISPAGVYGKCL